MKGVSVIVCCHNSADRLKPTLEHLSLQEITGFEMEVILVDNASTDNTVSMANSIWEEAGNTFPFSLIYENRPGLSFARFKGIKKSKYGFVVFCDDDNWLAKNYIQTAFELMIENPEIGMLGGMGIAEIKGDQPVWFHKYAGLYAVGSQSKTQGDITHRKAYVYGAGAVIRKEGIEKILNLGTAFLLSDRIGNKLISGGDNEIGYCLVFAGYKIHYDERLVFKHFIPASRLTLEYIKKMRKAYANSFDIIRAYQTLLNSNGTSRRTEKKRYQEHVLIGKKLIRVVYKRLKGDIDNVQFIFSYYAYLHIIKNGLQKWKLLNRNQEMVYKNFKLLCK